MNSLTSQNLAVLLLSLAVLLSAARVLGEIAGRLNQPAVVGEMLAGILLGKTVLGRFAPEAFEYLFPAAGPVSMAFSGLSGLAIVLFLVVAGMEVDLSTVWRQGRTALAVGLGGMILPFGMGLLAALWQPALLGHETGASPRLFAFFVATALAISALPVIAKTLLDLNLYRSDMGMLIVAAAVFNDLLGWIIFAVLLSMMGSGTGPHFGIGVTVGLTLAFTVVTLTFGRALIHRVLPFIQAHTTWPGGVLGFALALALFGAAFTEWIGVHAIFGSFLVGVAVGDSAHLREQTRMILHQFISFIFAPLFFAGIGLNVDFAANFDVVLITVVTALACISKVLGCGLAGKWSGMPAREAWAVGMSLNARGGMIIILGLLALETRLIGNRMFVALVVMALVTSMMSGPMMQRILRLRRPRRLTSLLSARAFLNPLPAASRWEAIQALSQAVCNSSGLDPRNVADAVVAREQLMPTGLGNSLAVPHARIEGLQRPLLGLGLSESGVDFDAPDGEPAQLVFLILTPEHDNGAQLEILADIARTFRSEERRRRVLGSRSYTEFLAALKTVPD